MVPKSEVEARLARFSQVCRLAGLKVTQQRLEIFRAVASTDAHPDADQIFRTVQKKLPTISLDTVYRTLWTMIDQGLLSNLGPGQRGARFDANLDPHHHFVCSQCGLTADFRHPAFDRLTIPTAVRRMGKIKRVQVEFRGVCTRCNGEGSKPRSRA